MYCIPFDHGNDNDVFLLSSNVEMNINYALISIHCITQEPNYDHNIFSNKFVYYFFHIQSILTACGNIRSAFFSKKYRMGMDPKTHKYSKAQYQNDKNDDISQKLRDKFHVDKKQYPIIFNNEFRNTLIHSDERVVEHNANVGDYNILDSKTPKNIINEILTTTHLRTLDLRTMNYYSYDRNQKQISFSLYDLKDELNKLIYQMNTYNDF